VNPRSFFGELKRRNVYKVAVAYAVVSWLLIQIATQVFPFFEIPNWAVRLIVLAIVVGFPIALIIAWAFELTPEGIRRTEEVDLTATGASKSRTWIYIVVVGAALSIGLFFIGRYTASNSAQSGRPPSIAGSEKSIAVLPFLNESGDTRDEYFSDGLSEELIAALAQIAELKVIGRSSSFRFKERTRTFDRELKDIFAVQTEIAAAVAESLKVTLLGADEQSTSSATKSTEAHNAYLQGHFHFQRRNLEDFRKAVSYFDEAIRLDPDYALAYAERSEAWSLIGDLTGRRATAWPKAKSDAEKAVAIAPYLAEAHAALGWVRFFVDWKFAEGLSELKRAKELSPANPTANDLLARVIVYLGKSMRLSVTPDMLWNSILFLLQRKVI